MLIHLFLQIAELLSLVVEEEIIELSELERVCFSLSFAGPL